MSTVIPMADSNNEGKPVKQWSDDMGEISGFGGGYEAVCRSMVLAGIAWIDEHPTADPHFRGYKGVYGVISEDNDDAKQLVEAMMNAPVFFEGAKIQEHVKDDCTGAMHHASCQHVMAYKKLGWDEYCKQLRGREKEEAENPSTEGAAGVTGHD
jgi:hypothetical protein